MIAVTALPGWDGTARAQDASTCLTGSLTYTRPDAEAGPSLPMVTSPARNANWALFDHDHPGFGDRPLSAGLTDNDGTFDACADGDSGRTLYLVFEAESSTLWQVLTSDQGVEQPYTFTIPVAAGTHDLGAVAVPESMAGAWKILDTMNLLWWKRPAGAGSCWTSRPPRDACTPISFVWPLTGDRSGVSYFSTAGLVYLTDADADTRHITLHEAGHNYQWLWQGERWAHATHCSPHYVNLASSPSCAFTEGFATAVADHALGDHRFVWANGQSESLPTDPATPNWDTGDSVEGRVSAALLDLWDGPDGGWDKTLDILTHTIPADFHDYFYNQRPTVGLPITGQAAAIVHTHTVDRPSPSADPRNIDQPHNTPLGPPGSDGGVKHEPKPEWRDRHPHWVSRPPHPRPST
ncbi:metalloprotease [Nocardia inohanensis]|uniref:metalloprotease n=1 Tax=Nocardia inohanensis TaxID=209246 RepID=UPI000A7AD147|nr:metalloprotease [Nocardia inohanensis]